MTIIDTLLQRCRMNEVQPFIQPHFRLLDIGCHQGELLWLLKDQIAFGMGIDPLCTSSAPAKNLKLVKGVFPGAIPHTDPFDAITALALIEHIPKAQQADFFIACNHWLNPEGLLICTIPDKKVDCILLILKKLRLVKGMSLEQHYGFEVRQTPQLGTEAGFILLRRKRFQLGLNNVFVFQKPGL